MRVGLVLGGGGVRGAAWLIGALQGVAAETGWLPAQAELVVGTSAGAVVAALAAGGPAPWATLTADRSEVLLQAAAFRAELTFAALRPGSLELALCGWRSAPRDVPMMAAGLLPRGFVSTEPIARLVREQVPGGWPGRPQVWLAATDYRTGVRVFLGRPGAPAGDLGSAVAASCAVPGFYRPVEVGGRLYVDGGIGGGVSLDLTAGLGLDLVVCLDPISCARPEVGRGGIGRIRRRIHAQLAAQARVVEAAGTPVLLLEPAEASIRLMGLNLLSRRRVAAVRLAAVDEVRRHLRRPEAAEILARMARAA
jgi:NTE family protein